MSITTRAELAAVTDASFAEEVLASDRYAAAVRESEAHFQQLGIHAVPAAEPTDPWPGLVQDIFSNRPMNDGSDVIAIEMPYRAEDAAIVPVTLRTKLSPAERVVREEIGGKEVSALETRGQNRHVAIEAAPFRKVIGNVEGGRARRCILVIDEADACNGQLGRGGTGGSGGRAGRGTVWGRIVMSWWWWTDDSRKSR